jgi:hypothetical protein
MSGQGLRYESSGYYAHLSIRQFDESRRMIGQQGLLSFAETQPVLGIFPSTDNIHISHLNTPLLFVRLVIERLTETTSHAHQMAEIGANRRVGYTLL